MTQKYYTWLKEKRLFGFNLEIKLLEVIRNQSDPVQHIIALLCYHGVYQPYKPVVLQQTLVPNSLPMGANYADYEPQGIEVIQVCLQTTPKRGGCNGQTLHQNNSSTKIL